MFEQCIHMKLIVGLSIFGILIGACQGQTASPVWSPSESPIDRLEGEGLVVPVIPTPYPGYGVVVGRLVTESPVDLVGLSIFLGDVIVLGEETHVAFLNRQIAPRGRLDVTNGWFVFERVNPGLYALVVSEPELGSWVYTQSSDIKIVEVSADQVVNLGEVLFNR